MKPLNKIMLWKRKDDRAAALKTQMNNAVACLAESVGSIIDDDSVDKNAMLARTFVQFLDHCNGLTKRKTSPQAVFELQKIFGVAKNDSERSEPDLSDTNAGMPKNRRRRAGDDDDDNEKDKTDMTEKSHSLSNIVKRHGFIALAKAINTGSVTLTETEYTQALIDDCARRGVSFEKVFCDTSPEGLEIRKGRERCRDEAFLKGTLMPMMPTQTNTLAEATDVNSDDSEPYQQLMAIARRMHDASPELTLEQCFSRAFESPEHRALANKERAQAHTRSMALGGGMVPI